MFTRTAAAGTVAAAAVVLALATSGCSSSASGSTSGSGGAVTGTIRISAASSLTEAFNTIRTRFVKANPGVQVTITYGASSDLATQITNGAPVDVFASASTKNMDSVTDADHPTNFASNTLEIATPPSNPAGISDVADLAESGVKVAVCDPAVPCGAVAQQVFANAKVTVRPAASEPDVKSTLSAVESGEVDAGLVYVTDVRSAGAKVKGVMIPGTLNASTEYPIAALTTSKHAAAAKAFVDYVLSPKGKAVLTADGFNKP